MIHETDGLNPPTDGSGDRLVADGGDGSGDPAAAQCEGSGDRVEAECEGSGDRVAVDCGAEVECGDGSGDR